MRVDIRPYKKKESYFIIIPYGPIDTDTHDDFRKRVDAVLTKSVKGFLIDLKHVEYISSAGLGVLFAVKKHLDTANAELVFCHLKPQIKKLFDEVKVLKDSVFKSIEEADAYLYSLMEREITSSRKAGSNKGASNAGSKAH